MRHVPRRTTRKSPRKKVLVVMPVLGIADLSTARLRRTLAAFVPLVLLLVLTPSALAAEAKPETTLMRARRLGLATSRLPSLDDGGEAQWLRLSPIIARPAPGSRQRTSDASARSKSWSDSHAGGVARTVPTCSTCDRTSMPMVRMRALANQHHVLIVENPPLARSLYRLAEPDDYLPEQHYSEVAKILVWVFALKAKQGRANRKTI